ncbi:hypothetical protein os1_16150 [Comamonadaceae bacterium OS-1]|nr:hypothetical protein os1_16150 [Comamonadaceae bacterium OS-1]
MKKTLSFSVSIHCPLSLVWDTMLSPEGYRAWTAAFMEGCYFSGSWEAGQKIQFLAPNGDGMVAVIAENRLHEFISIRHLGEVIAGVEDTTGPKALTWAPAYENYTFVETAGTTEVTVDLDTPLAHVAYMQETFPRALALLKSLCESKSPSAA